MLTRICRAAVLIIGILLSASPGWSQFSAIFGKVVGEDGQPVKGALIKIERTDERANFKIKTNRGGKYTHAGLPYGIYKITLLINDQETAVDSNVRLGGKYEEVSFDLEKIAQQRQAQTKAAQGGISERELRAMSTEERKRYEETLAKREGMLRKNERLNTSVNAGMEAMRAGDFTTAVTNLTAALESNPEQAALWANLAQAQSRLSRNRIGDARNKLIDEAVTSYRKAIELRPQDASFYNNLGLLLVRMGQLEQGTAELVKAAELDPANSATYYYNLGATMINTGDSGAAIDAFHKAIAANPKHAQSHFQLGTVMAGSAQINEDGSIKPLPGTIEAFKAYLSLQPNGANAQAAQAMLETLQGTVETTFKGNK